MTTQLHRRRASAGSRISSKRSASRPLSHPAQPRLRADLPMTSDPHHLQPDHLPTPFTADEIRAACQPGRTLRSLVVRPNSDPIVRVTRFVSADADGAEQDSWEETPDGARLGEAKRRRSTWLEFQEHASFPAATTERSAEEIEIPAGRFACLRDVARDGDSIQTFGFARSVPGMPLRFDEHVGG